MGQSRDTHDVGADLATEDRVLSDHDNDFRREMENLYSYK